MRFNGSRRTVLFVLVGLTAFVAVAVGVTVGLAIASVRNIEEISRSTETESALPSVLIDRDGTQITELFSDEKRTLVSIEELPRHVIYALLTREDSAFFQHNGFSLMRMASAAVNIALYQVSGGRFGYFSGASTITQQLAKMMYTDQSVTITRKLIELWWALQLERHLTKYEILEEYLNRMPFGHGTYGIEAASQFYFGHPATELSVAESVMLILQLSSPGFRTYSPFANPENARRLQREILDQMVELGYITDDEADESFAEYWANHDFTRAANTGAFLERLENDPAPWFTEHVRERLQDELLLGSANIYTDGYRVFTTLDLDYQRAAQRHLWEGIQNANETYRRNQANSEARIDRFVPMVDMLGLGFDAVNLNVGTERDEKRAAIHFRDEISPMLDIVSMMFDANEQDAMRQITRAAYLEQRRVTEQTQVQGALITIENDTGHILALVGGSPFETGNQNNRALRAQRPPGSSFKPLYYAAAIDAEVISPSSVFMDAPVVFWNNDGTPYIPENYNGTWDGPTRARDALATSMNVVSLRILERVGFAEGLGTAGRLLGLNDTQMAQRGFEPRYPVGLGTVSVSPMLMAKAFATFPNGGREVIPVSILKIEDRRGNQILAPAQDVAQELVRKGRDAQIISPQAAYIMVDMLRSTVEYGTLRNRRLMVGGFDGMPMAGKTGTTQNWSDAWTVGFSPYVTTAVWLGFDRGGNNSLGTNQTGAQTAGPIWAWYMKEIHENLPIREFERPPGVVEVTVTAESGKLPTEDYRGSTITELFIAGSRTIPTEFDDSEDFHEQRSARIAAELSRPTVGRPSSSVRDRIFALGLLDTTTRDDRPTTTSFGTGSNPFFDDTDNDDTQEPANRSPFDLPDEETTEPASDEPAPPEAPSDDEASDDDTEPTLSGDEPIDGGAGHGEAGAAETADREPDDEESGGNPMLD